MKAISLLLATAAVTVSGAATHLDGPRWARHYNAAMKAQHDPQRVAGIYCGPVYGGRLYACDIAVTPKPHAAVACLVVGLYPDGLIHDQRQTACPWDPPRQPSSAVKLGPQPRRMTPPTLRIRTHRRFRPRRRGPESRSFRPGSAVRRENT